MLMRKSALTMILALVLAAAQPALAQRAGPNGGLVAGKGGHQTELVVTPAEITVFILEDGKTHDAEGVKIRAVVQDGGKTASIDLVNVGGKKLVGKLSAPLGKGAIVVLSGKDDHGDVISARYVLN
jgi:hypothetical protein